MSDPTVLGMINDNLTEIKTEQKKVTDCMGKMKVSIATNTVRLNQMGDEQKELKKDFQHHVQNKKKHYNQGYVETLPQKILRKKGELTAGGLIATVIAVLVNYFFGG